MPPLRPLRALLLFVALCLASLPVHADPIDDAADRFAGGSFDAIEEGISALAATGSDRAAEIIGALGDRRLLVGADGLFVRTSDGTLVAARSGLPATVDPAALKEVRVNNRIRRAAQAALGALTLMAPDPGRRLQAARAVFTSRDAAALPVLDEAIAKESVPQVRAAMEMARAAILIGERDVPLPDRLAAVETLRMRGDRNALALLNAVPQDAPAELREAAAAAAGSIEHRLQLAAIGQNVAYGISLGSVLLLAAVGLAITFGVMGVINMAHGEMVMIGAYATFIVQELVRAHAPGLFGASLFIAIPVAFLTAGAVGVAIERGVIRFLYGRPLETLLATWGISLVLQQAVRTIFGPTNREVGTPAWMSGAFDLWGMTLTWNRLAIVVFALAVFAALLLVLHRTPLGLQIRAVTQNRRMAASMGIRTDRVDAMTFGLGSGVAGMAGVALSQIDNVSPNLGQGYIIDSFLVVVFGGVGNLWGTFVGAFTIGIANKFLEPYAGAVLGKIVLLVAIILFIQKRPRGLFALKGRAVEA
ncbi:urea ABC transporter permease subunit UrtB [Faunimonas sp. B44]|uniref:urea ABC transporter permease subunit UrtB n=1 Tax=Faunimonas sp. B44 TaxID=3461493 RepID=UPI004044143B